MRRYSVSPSRQPEETGNHSNGLRENGHKKESVRCCSSVGSSKWGLVIVAVIFGSITGGVLPDETR